jgi:pimeloyl-ACP methyl ester carboxylesterase
MILPVRRSRRDFLEVGGSAIGALAADVQLMKTTTFVLVHPAWHGSWFWKKVTPLLRHGGHTVSTPTLTGLGERTHLARPEIGLDVHVSDVVNVLEHDDLRDVVLVGHSSSGAVVTGVADRAPERIGQVVYLDAFVPEDGQGVFDLIAPERRRVLEELVRTEGSGWLLPRFAPPPWETIVRDLWGVTDSTDAHWMIERLAPTPVGHFRDAVRRRNPAAEKLPRTYVRCLQFPNPRFDQHAEMARQTPGWRYRELNASHHAALTIPDEVARMLLNP